MDTIAIQTTPKNGMGCEMSLHRRKLIRHVNSVIPNSGIAKSVMPGVVDVRPTVPDAEWMSKTNSTMSLRTRFARNLRACRVRQDLSQEQLASMAGFSRTFVSDVEREVRNCTIDNIERLALALKLDVSVLFVPVGEDDAIPEVLPKGPRSRRANSSSE